MMVINIKVECLISLGYDHLTTHGYYYDEDDHIPRNSDIQLWYLAEG